MAGDGVAFAQQGAASIRSGSGTSFHPLQMLLGRTEQGRLSGSIVVELHAADKPDDHEDDQYKPENAPTPRPP